MEGSAGGWIFRNQVDAIRRIPKLNDGSGHEEKLGVQTAINARVATAAMAANEVLARIADIASCDLLDFILRRHP